MKPYSAELIVYPYWATAQLLRVIPRSVTFAVKIRVFLSDREVGRNFMRFGCKMTNDEFTETPSNLLYCDRQEVSRL